MSKKYEILTDESITAGNLKLYRIRALKDFSDVKAGDIGGFIQSEANLSQSGKAWIYDFAQVFGKAHVYGNAQVYNNEQIIDYVIGR